MGVRRLLAEILRQFFKPKEALPAAEWCERNIRLSSKTSAIAGRYSLRATPYLKRLFQDVDDPRIRKIVLKKSAQVGATQFAANLLLFYTCNHSFPALMIMPSKESAQQFCERSLRPSIELCGAIKPFLTGNEDDLKKTEYLFTNSITRVIGAGSPSKLASNQACLCIVDEADKMEDFAGEGEAPALELAEMRTATYPADKKVVILSTPTTENTSVVHSEYLKGSQSKYFVACPHCAHWQTLRFEQVKWPDGCKDGGGAYDLDRVERESWYECEGCKARLTERDKAGMVRGGEWRDTNPKPFPSEVRSYSISGLYSFNVTFGALAKLFLLSKDDVGKMRAFWTGFLGECWEQRAETLKPTAIDALVAASPSYRKGELHAEPAAILMGVDVQGLNFWYCVEAVFLDGSCAVIDWGQAATWSDVERVSQSQYPVKGTGGHVGIARSLIDIGYKSDEVGDFIVRMGGRFTAVRGVGSNQGLLNPVGEQAKEHKGRTLPVLLVNDNYFKDLLYLSGFQQRAFPIFFPTDTDEVLKRQCTAENKVEKKTKTGRLETFWQCTARNNHMGDCLKYIEAFKWKLEPQLRQARAAAARKGETQPASVPRQYTLSREPAHAGGWD